MKKVNSLKKEHEENPNSQLEAQNGEFKIYTQRPIYDIDHTIFLLKQIESKCDNNLMAPQDFMMSLKISLRKLIAMLEVERASM